MIMVGDKVRRGHEIFFTQISRKFQYINKLNLHQEQAYKFIRISKFQKQNTSKVI